MSKLSVTETDRFIGKRIQQKRKELGFSAAELSEQIGIAQQQLSRYERGASKINVNHLIDIAIFFKTPINWFFQDCIPEEVMAGDLKELELNQKWDNLSIEQKRAFIYFLETLR